MTMTGRRADDPEPSLLVRKREAARLLSVSVDTLEALVRTGQLPSVRVGRRVLIPRSALTALADAHLTSI
jgi:excisionase family DNA binding protein